jgi:uncharacterized coiled-coil DUF342 family protein
MVRTDWKAKAMRLAKDIKSFKKRIKELIESRDNWKSKAMMHKRQYDEIKAELEKIKKKLNEIIK